MVHETMQKRCRCQAAQPPCHKRRLSKGQQSRTPKTCWHREISPCGTPNLIGFTLIYTKDHEDVHQLKLLFTGPKRQRLQTFIQRHHSGAMHRPFSVEDAQPPPAHGVENI